MHQLAVCLLKQSTNCIVSEVQSNVHRYIKAQDCVKHFLFAESCVVGYVVFSSEAHSRVQELLHKLRTLFYLLLLGF